MSVDNVTESGNIDTSATEASTSNQSPDSSATPASTATAVESPQTTTEASPASAATSTESQSASSLTADTNTTLKAAPPAAGQPDPFKERYDSLRREQNRWAAERKQYEHQLSGFQGVDANAVRAWREAQEKAQRENLPVWNPKNPNAPKFNQTLTRYQAYKEAYTSAQTPEERDVLKRTVGSRFSTDEAQQIEQWESHQRDFGQKMASDPESAIADIVERRVEAALGRFQQFQQANTEVGSWFDKPENKSVVQKFGPALRQALQDGVPWNYAQTMASMAAQLDSFQSRVAPAEREAAHAKAQDQLLKGQAAVTRDPQASRRVDPIEVARQRKIPTSGEQYLDLLRELNAKGLLPE